MTPPPTFIEWMNSLPTPPDEDLQRRADEFLIWLKEHSHPMSFGPRRMRCGFDLQRLLEARVNLETTETHSPSS
jgi:hypothetical protein